MANNPIFELRQQLLQNGVEAMMVATGDEFNSEHPPTWARRLEWLTGFTGSNGLAVIAQERCYFYTDGRYFTQAQLELGEDFTVSDIRQLTTEALADISPVIGYEPMLHTHSMINKYASGALQLVPLPGIIDRIWHRTMPPIGQHYRYDNISDQRIAQLLAKLDSAIDWLLIPSPDQVCWLYGVRGSDLEYSPVALNYGVLSHTGGLQLFNHWRNLIDFFDRQTPSNVQLNPEQTPSAIVKAIEHRHNVRMNVCEIELMRAVKNPDEITSIKQSHISDGIAISCFFHWFSQQTTTLDEYRLGKRLLEFREQMPNFVSASFPSICGFQENGAIIHYNAPSDGGKRVEGDGLLLLDSGGQYRGGTTDVTRVLPIGNTKELWRYHYTLVLKSHIELARLRWPKTATGAQLDAIARASLWQQGMDYPHGTGHGVGCFLNVHEGPLNISPNCHKPLLPGAVLSNEPGLYFPGEYGIRLENLMLVVPDAEHANHLCFESLTLVPLNKKLIDRNILSSAQQHWLDTYQRLVFDTLSPHLPPHISLWLRNECL